MTNVLVRRGRISACDFEDSFFAARVITKILGNIVNCFLSAFDIVRVAYLVTFPVNSYPAISLRVMLGDLFLLVRFGL